MKQKLYWLLTLMIISLPMVWAQDNDFSSIDWGDTFSTFDVIGNVFKNLGNFIQLFWKAAVFWVMVVFYFAILALIFWLPLKLYPTFIQYNNFFQRIFKIGGQS
jgi:hypothetical protein